MLGKRARAHMMRRTTSTKGMVVDPAGRDEDMEAPPSPLGPSQNPIGPLPDHMVESPADAGDVTMMVGVGPTPLSSVQDHDHHHWRLTAMLSPRYYRRDLADDHDHGGLENANFLRICGQCNRRLATGRDLYMYRGDTAFCSEECREQRMKQDERNEKHNMASLSKKVDGHHNQYSELNNSAASDSSSSNSETVAAA